MSRELGGQKLGICSLGGDLSGIFLRPGAIFGGSDHIHVSPAVITAAAPDALADHASGAAAKEGRQRSGSSGGIAIFYLTIV